MKIDVVEALHQPEYTGENRCEPCTILNLAIAAILSSLIARKSKLGGLIAIVCSIGLIYLRGYLIPGTPTLTKRYLPPEILRWFGKETEPVIASGLGSLEAETGGDDAADKSDANDATGANEPISASSPTAEESAAEESAADATEGADEGKPEPGPDSETGRRGDGDGEPEAGMDLETYFLAQDILEPCEDSDDLCLTEPFETAWFEEIEPVASSDIGASAAVEAFGFEADPADFELVTRDDVHTLRTNASRTGQWPSRPALVADIAASRVFESWIDDWETFDPAQKGQVLNSLRMFLETCPTTDGEIQMGEEVVESCCSSHKVFAVTCEDTDERLFEHRITNA